MGRVARALGVVVLLVLIGAVAKLLMMRTGFVASEEAHRLVAGGALLLDVRSPGEFAAGHIKGAINIPVGDIEARLAEVGPRDRPVITYCKSGMRSTRAATTLRTGGYQNVHNLGGIGRW